MWQLSLLKNNNKEYSIKVYVKRSHGAYFFQPCRVGKLGGGGISEGLISYQPYRFGDLGEGVITDEAYFNLCDLTNIYPIPSKGTTFTVRRHSVMAYLLYFFLQFLHFVT